MDAGLNQFQIAALRAYAGGDYAYLIDDPEFDPRTLDLGDTLLTFILIELSDAEDCEDADTAWRRINMAVGDLLTVQEALEALTPEN